DSWGGYREVWGSVGQLGASRGGLGVPAAPLTPRAPSAVRTRLYQVLELWVEVAGAASGVLQGPGAPGEVLLAHLLSDITPPAEGIKLKADLKPSAPKRPKLGDGGDAPALHRKLEPAANSDVCRAALRGTGGGGVLGPPRGHGGLHPFLRAEVGPRSPR
ncbi:UNVERIFIED_CONTAM: Proline-, glutamic acid- and leucine-rich protein 1, partial [Eudyptes pachyrhynchus]